jgi:arylsulfatase A-like enzyme
MNIKTGIITAAGTTILTAAPLHAAEQKQERPNIVFIEVDDLLYRFMGKTGRNFVDTPNIDALAQNGVFFSNAVCQGLMCGPSRNSLITGLYAHNIGFYRNGHMGPLPNNIWSLGKGLKNAGYNTAWVGKCHVHPPAGTEKKKRSSAEGLKSEMGFDYAIASLGRAMLAGRARSGKQIVGDVYFDHLEKKGLLKLYIEDCKKKRPTTSLPEDDYLDGFYTKKATEWIDNNKGKQPFFLWMNFSCPHGPFDVPQKYHDIYKDRTIPPPLTTDFGGVQVPAGLLKDNKAVNATKAADGRRGFAANVTFVDKMIGKIINKLKADGLYENSVIFFFSDHGIFMGNHGRIHKGTLFNEVTNPSLIIHYPKKFRKGVIEKTPVELLSIVKTALDIADASPEDKAKPFGESLIPLLTGKGEYKTKYVFSEIEGFQLCFDGRYRYIANKEKPLLYDTQNDPTEMKNIADSSPEIVAKMQKAIDDWIKKSGPLLPAKHLRNAKNLKDWKRTEH